MVETKKLTKNNCDTNHHHYGAADVVISTTNTTTTTTTTTSTPTPIIKRPLSFTERQSNSSNVSGGLGAADHQWLSSSLSNDNNDSHKKNHESPMKHFVGQIPAVLLVGVLNLMIGIPFGVSYFPIEWTSSDGSKQSAADEGGGGGGDDGSGVGYGAFPLPEKDALGIRMFLFSSIVGQIIFAYTSSFKNAVGMQMVENVPFCHSLAYICLKEQGYGREALSTLFFLFGFSSVIVGLVFFALGYWEMGRVVYFFPNHVLIGCIGGIGVFVMKVGIEVGTNAALSLSSVIAKRHLLAVVLAFEIVLRILLRITRDANGKARCPLLAPIYYCAITPVFYAVIILGGMSFDNVQAAGYFFDPLGGDDGTSSIVFDGHLFDIWRVLDFRLISWTAVAKSVPTLISLAAFSLIHVPINIPAFAISTNAECDMNKELRSHGYSNFFAGVLGGLQNYLCYANSVLYAKSNGEGKLSSLLICFLTGILFVIGPSIASYIPRCMAGTLLLHVGIDLFLEGVYDSYDMFDKLEYAGIWFITIVMTMYGMSAALLAGIIAALSTYAVQSVTYLNPVRGAMTATTLRSSRWKRSARENAILDDRLVGRKKIYVIQLHGHIFFGNVTQLSEKIENILKEKIEAHDDAWIVIIDFTLVLGIDSSAAHAILKLAEKMHKKYHVNLNIFVTGSNDGFPCEYDLSRKLSSGSIATNCDHPTASSNAMENHFETTTKIDDDSVALLRANRRSSIKRMDSRNILLKPIPTQPMNHICTNLDEALMHAEDTLINRYDPTLIPSSLVLSASPPIASPFSSPSSLNDDEDYLEHEKDLCLRFLSDLCPKIDSLLLQRFIANLTREVYHRGDVIWYQGSQSHCLKILVKGTLLSILEDEAGTTEDISTGNIIGELGLVNNTDRLSTVTCDCTEAVLYSLERDVWERLLEDDPKAVRCVYVVAVHYLAHRVQHVSNRIFETRCLPV